MTISKTDEISQSLPIPVTKLGWIVGKKGSYINQLCNKSGASISISDSVSKEFGITWKYLQITGTGRSVDRAKKLIHIRLSNLEARNASQSFARSAQSSLSSSSK